MICKKCGASVPDTTYECPFCGTKIGKVMPEPEEPSPVEEAPAAETAAADESVFDENERKRREQVQKMMDEKQQQLNEIQERRERKRKKAQRTKAAIIAAVCLGVGGAAYGVTSYVSNHSGTQQVEETEQPQESADPNASPEATAEETELPSTEPLATVGPDTPDNRALNSTAATNGTSSSGTASGSSSGTSGNSTGRTSSGNSSWSATGNTGSGSGGRTSSGGSPSNGRSSSSSSSSSGSSSGGTTSSGITSSGVVRTNMNAAAAKGGEVIYDSNSGRYIMTFISNNKEYYAYVSEGSTTDQIYGKNMTVTAVPTGNTFRGSTVFDITSLTTYDGNYILKNSGTQLLTESDIAGMSKEQIALARNEIFARHGRPFSTPEYKRYFESCSWYRVNPNYNLDDDMSNLNETEQKNVNFLLSHEL